MLRFAWMFSILFYSFNIDSDYLEWSEDNPLQFSDFKGVVPAGTSGKVNLSTIISYQTKQIQGSPPEITIYNRMDRNNSWIAVQKQEVLHIQQIHFNTSELYARKIRKEIKKMNDNKVVEKEKYAEMIKKHTSTLHKIQKSKKMLLEDQPYLIKLNEKEITDSLNLYKDFTK